MHTGTSYTRSEFLQWTRRDLYVLLVLGVVPVVAYQIGHLKWRGMPWTVGALLGTATALIVGFNNLQTYNRTWEARQIWGDIISSRRAWGIMSRDFCDHADTATALVYRHLAWLTALRYQLREPRAWETTSQAHNAEYLQDYAIPERQTALATELANYLPEAELKQILATGSKATQIMSLQSQTLTGLFASQAMVVAQFLDMHRLIKECLWHQGRCERLTDFPYPRQYATINALFIKLFCLLLPFELLREFAKLNDSVEGVLKGHMVWLVIPFSVLISWMYTSLERVGESTERPFAGSANDVPISHLCRAAESELREMLGETDVPPPLAPRHNIVL
jgi:ion channel-forming bestrophin family protein